MIKRWEIPEEKRLKIKSNFIKKYPNADISMKQDGTVESTAIYFKNSDILSTYITSDTILNDKAVTRYLYSNKVKQL